MKSCEQETRRRLSLDNSAGRLTLSLTRLTSLLACVMTFFNLPLNLPIGDICHLYGDIFGRKLLHCIVSLQENRRSLNALRPLDHPYDFVIRVYELHGNSRMASCEDAEDFVSKCLPDLTDIFEVENDRPEPVNPQQEAFR